MNAYTVTLITGGVGLLAMAVSGMSHHGHDGGSSAAHSHAHDGHDVTAAGHADSSSHGASGSHGDSHSHMPGWVLALLTPRAFFSALTGFGVAGVAFSALGEPLRFALALIGGLLFEMVL